MNRFVSSLLALSLALWFGAFVGAALAQDRPGTPTDVFAYECWGYLEQPAHFSGPPSACVTFFNTADEEVTFDVQWTENGAARTQPEMKEHIGCMLPSNTIVGCAAAWSIAGVRNASTQVGKEYDWGWAVLMMTPGLGMTLQAEFFADPEAWETKYGNETGGDRPEQGFYLENLEFGTEYCFRLKARAVDTGRVSELWSNLSCVTTSNVPPPPQSPRPRAVFHETFFDRNAHPQAQVPPRIHLDPGTVGPVSEITVEAHTYGFDDSEQLEFYFGPSEIPRGAEPRMFPISNSMVPANGPPVLVFRVCALNYSGKACAETSTAPLPAAERNGPLSSEVVLPPPGTDKVVVLPPGERTYIESIGKAHVFTGDWVTIANGGSWSFDMKFNETTSGVTGTYVVRETGGTGTLTGVRDGRNLNFEWSDANGYAGNGTLRLSADGRSFSGSYAVGYIPPGLTADLLQGTWEGTLSRGGSTAAVPPPRTYIESIGKAQFFTGDWVTVANGGSWSFNMNFNDTANGVTGSYVVRETGGTGTLNGVRDGRNLNFEWSDANGYAGNGTLRISGDGQTFSGTYDVTYIPPGLTADMVHGTWEGTRAAAAQAPPDEIVDYFSCPGCAQPDPGPIVR